LRRWVIAGIYCRRGRRTLDASRAPGAFEEQNDLRPLTARQCRRRRVVYGRFSSSVLDDTSGNVGASVHTGNGVGSGAFGEAE
jgi:hypothetical protein